MIEIVEMKGSFQLGSAHGERATDYLLCKMQPAVNRLTAEAKRGGGAGGVPPSCEIGPERVLQRRPSVPLLAQRDEVGVLQ